MRTIYTVTGNLSEDTQSVVNDNIQAHSLDSLLKFFDANAVSGGLYKPQKLSD